MKIATISLHLATSDMDAHHAFSSNQDCGKIRKICGARTGRNSSIELLRCILMGFIVFGHCIYYSVYEWEKEKILLAVLLSIRFHVDGFVAVSGWFGIRFKWSKVVRLIGVFVFYSILNLVFNPSGFNSASIRSFRVSGGWFGGTYLMLMFIAPFLNLAIERLNDLEISKRRAVWAVFATGMVLNWVPNHFFTGLSASGGESHTLLTMVFVYVTMRLVATSQNGNAIRAVVLFAPIAYLLTIVTGALWAASRGLIKGYEFTFSSMKWITDYNSPGVWLMAIWFVTVFATKIKIACGPGRVVNFLAPSMFGVYLLHDTTSFGHRIFQIPQEWLRDNTSLSIATVITVSAFVVFAAGLLIDLTRRIGLALLFRDKINTLLSKVDEGWDKFCKGVV